MKHEKFVKDVQRNAAKAVRGQSSEPDKKTYLAQGGVNCPFCGSSEIEGEGFDYEGEHIFQDIYCIDCRKEWTDIFSLTDMEPK